MKDETKSVFYSDISEKKKQSYGARHKKNSSRTHYVHFEHEDLTESEWKKMNGPVQTYTINKPLTYGQFKSLPHDLQAEHIRYIKNRYLPTIPMVANVLGVTPPTLRKCLVTYGLADGWPKHIPAVARDRFERWVCGEELPSLSDVRNENKTEEPKPDAPEQDYAEIATQEEPPASDPGQGLNAERIVMKKVNGLESLNATYNLDGDPQPVIDLLQYLVWKEGKYTCHITLERQVTD